MFAHAIARRAFPAASNACRGCTRPILAKMPLRAKILTSQISTMSSQEALDRFRPQPGDEPEDVLFHSLYGLRSVELNRPSKLNALDGSMIRKIFPRLIEWSKSDMANVVVMKGAGDRAFCAGGDVAALARWNKEGPEGQQRSTDYFALEYQLDHFIATFNKPYIAFMDGITMGGGVGLSMHAPLRIATERTVFAMPETTIGLFPDVGGSFFLPRMPGAVGTYLALTSERVKGANVFYSGIATHYLHSTSLPALESRLAELRFRDADDMRTRLATIDRTIEEFCTGLPHDEPMQLAGKIRRAIDRCFRFDSVPEILAALEAETTNQHRDAATRAWARATLESLHKRSPTSVHVTLRQMRSGRRWSIAETFRRELQMAARFMREHDFTEGVTARLIEKPARDPVWEPASLEAIPAGTNIAAGHFSNKNTEPLELVSQGADYTEYPFGEFGVPTEEQVEQVVAGGQVASREGVVEFFVRSREGKQGVREIVKEIVERKTREKKGGLEWVY
ncbi:mitochondrial 3-hydroxyisobutyryl-CoA hydrolase [Echria macrotheca]|uniref:3-hydroxyisobutyryl-CoA hydrolase n=1 Tax=Echria macrotheca TaxID=438768 RepID=A0AAJ0BRW4_9PEZI|nr:mitochondrial 3-hydroxyisobutyryl-CoA hydrolase [Echria macrotheca]